MAGINGRILLADLDQDFASNLKKVLEREQFDVTHVCDADNAYAVLFDTRKGPFEICVFDTALPSMGGEKLVKLVRMRDKDVPIVLLATKAVGGDVIAGFQAGADGFYLKSDGAQVIFHRLEPLMRRLTGYVKPSEALLRCGIFEYYPDSRTFINTENGDTDYLQEKEGQVLTLLITGRGRLIRREELLHRVWKVEEALYRRSIDTYIAKLRKRLATDPCLRIETVHGVGFKLAIEKP